MLNYDVYIFTEGGSQVGLGHITRCAALYDEFERRGQFPLFLIYGERSVGEVIGKRNYRIDNWIERWSEYFAEEDSLKKYCIIDSYLADKTVYEGIQKKSRKALFLDDTNRIEYPPGMIVNPSMFGDSIPYAKQDGREYLTGDRYVILREEFRQKCLRNVKETPQDLLILLGGADIKNLTPSIIKALDDPEFRDLKKHIVIGKGFANGKEIEDISKVCRNTNLYYQLEPGPLYKLMQRCDFAITAAGQTTNELIAAKLPFLCIQIADNQRYHVEGLLANGFVHDYIDGDTKEFDPIKFERLLTEFIGGSIRKRIVGKMEQVDLCVGVRNIVEKLLSEQRGSYE